MDLRKVTATITFSFDFTDNINNNKEIRTVDFSILSSPIAHVNNGDIFVVHAL